jgi:hypothetical protein
MLINQHVLIPLSSLLLLLISCKHKQIANDNEQKVLPLVAELSRAIIAAANKSATDCHHQLGGEWRGEEKRNDTREWRSERLQPLEECVAQPIAVGLCRIFRPLCRLLCVNCVKFSSSNNDKLKGR